ERARKIMRAGPSDSTYYLIQTSPGVDIDSVRASVARNLKDAEVITPKEFRDRSLGQWLYGTGAGAALIVGAILGVIGGTVIVAQPLYSSTKDHLNDLALWRAIGSWVFYIPRVIICRVFLSAVIGFSIAASLSLIFVWVTANMSVPVIMTPILTLG